MTADDFIHLYCADCNAPYAMCGYFGPDEPPAADRLPRCVACAAMQDEPCPHYGAGGEVTA